MYYTPFPHSSISRCIARRPDASGRRFPIKALLCGPVFINCKEQKRPCAHPLFPSMHFPPLRDHMWVNSKQVPQISKAKTFGLGNTWSRNRCGGLKQTLERRKYQKLRRLPPRGILICISCRQRSPVCPHTFKA